MKPHKSDDRDAEAIADAATRPTMRFVPIKAEEQLDVQTLHRARERLVGTRTALINQLRGVLFDRGIVIAKGRPTLNLWAAREPAGLHDPNRQDAATRSLSMIAEPGPWFFM